MSLLFGELSKEDLLRQVVVSEMRKLDTGGKADLNQKDMGDRRRDRDDRGRRRGGDRGGRPFRKKPFNKKFKTKGGYKSKGIQAKDGPPSWNGQARQTDGRRQGQKEGQEEAVLQAWSGTLEHVWIKRCAWIQREEKRQGKATLMRRPALAAITSRVGSCIR